MPGSGDIYLWRLDREVHAPTWDSGIGAEMAGGRWNSKGVKAVYCSADPATAILEVAVHVGFETLDRISYILTCARLIDADSLHHLGPEQVPNPNWLAPGSPSAGQQAFGDEHLAKHPFLLVPSAVSRCSWNIVLNPELAVGRYELIEQERFALDTRLNPPRS